MICVGIDVAKDKHDCFILSSEGVVLVYIVKKGKASYDIPIKREHTNITTRKINY